MLIGNAWAKTRIDEMSEDAGQIASPEWRSMSSAPRDGTVIEIRNAYGICPWHGIFKWASSMRMEWYTHDENGRRFLGIEETPCNPCWVDVYRVGHRLDADSERYCSWRPYDLDLRVYIDPTHGAQGRPEYWTAKPDIDEYETLARE